MLKYLTGFSAFETGMTEFWTCIRDLAPRAHRSRKTYSKYATIAMDRWFCPDDDVAVLDDELKCDLMVGRLVQYGVLPSIKIQWAINSVDVPKAVLLHNQLVVLSKGPVVLMRLEAWKNPQASVLLKCVGTFAGTVNIFSDVGISEADTAHISLIEALRHCQAFLYHLKRRLYSYH